MDRETIRILLIEDDPDDAYLVRNLLADRWDGSNELIHAERLEVGLAHCRRRQFDVILLDLSLPDSRGLESFLRTYAEVPQVPVVVLTGLNDEAIAIKAVRAGAEDYLVKGQVDDHLMLRSIRYAYERGRRRRAERALQASEHDLRVARTVQQRLFPSSAPVLDGFSIAGAVYPADATGGDYFDYIQMSDGSLGIVIGDVTDHGLGSAFLMADTRAYLRALSQTHDDPGEILTHANRFLCDDTQGQQFVTLVFARIDPESRMLVYAAAGHVSFLLNATGNARMLDSTSLPLGFERNLTVWCAQPIELEPGQLVLLATDGAWEARSPANVQLGVDRMLDVVREHRHASPDQIVKSIYDHARRHSHPLPQRDDITAVVIKIEEKAAR